MKAVVVASLSGQRLAIPGDVYFDAYGNIFLGTGVGALIQIGHSGVKNNLTATVAPTATDDVNKGYSLGSGWFNKISQTIYFLQDGTAGAAVWTSVAGGGGSMPAPSTFPGFVQGNTQALSHNKVTDTWEFTDLG